MPPPSKTRIITKKPVYSKKNNPYKAIHRFKRTYNFGVVSSAAATPVLTGVNFSMNDMPGYTELTALFDYYKLTGVLYKMIPYQQTVSNSVRLTTRLMHLSFMLLIILMTLHLIPLKLFLNTTITRSQRLIKVSLSTLLTQSLQMPHLLNVVVGLLLAILLLIGMA